MGKDRSRRKTIRRRENEVDGGKLKERVRVT